MDNNLLQQLAAKYLAGTSTDAEKQQLNAWYNQFNNELEVTIPANTNETEASLEAKMKSRLLQVLDNQPAKRKSLFSGNLQPLKAAAMVVLLAGGAYLGFRQFGGTEPTNTPQLVEKDKIKKFPKKDRIDLAIEQEVALTMDPRLRAVPRERLVNAYAYKNARLASNFDAITNQAVTGISWAERGPSNVGGRSRVAVFDLTDGTNGYKKVWAGGVGGGLWSTNDITVTAPVWTKVNDFFDNLAITAFAQDPTNPQVIYVGTGEGWFNADAIEGLGLFKSTDGGTTWNRMLNTANFVYVQDIVINAAGHVFVSLRNRVAAHAVGVQKSTDGGANWTQVLGSPVLGPSVRGGDLEIAANGDIYANIGFGSNGRIYRSPGGATAGDVGTWVDITPDPTTNTVPAGSGAVYSRIELACAPSDASVMYALFQGISSNDVTHIKQYDAATNTWVSRTIPRIIDQGSNSIFTRSQAWYDLIAAVDPNNAASLYIGAVDALRSDDNGTTWTQMTTWSLFGATGFAAAQNVHADHHAITYAPGSSSRALWGTDGGIDYTANANIANTSKPTFEDKNTGYNVTQFYASANHPTNPNFFLTGAQDNGSQRFTTAGINATTEVTGGDGAFCHIDQDNPNIQITSYVYNNYYVSTNGGASFASYSKNNNGGFINPTDYDDAANILYCGNTAGTYFRWLDPATNGVSTSVSVSAFSGSSITHVTVSPLTANRVYFGLANGSVVKVDNANATPTASVIRTGFGSVSSVAIDPANENHLLLTYSNYGVVSVLETQNATAATPTWTTVEGNLPDMPIRWAMFDPRNSDWALLATELGVWSTNNLNGTSTEWNPTNTGLANVRVDMLQYASGTRVISAATHGRGLYTASVPPITTPDVNFVFGTGSATEQTSASSGCRSYRDYTYNMSIANAPSSAATATLAVVAGATATEGVDFDITTNGNFASPSKILTFPAGSTATQPVTVRIYNDAEIEPTESFQLEYALSGGSNAQRGASYQTLSIGIVSDDAAPIFGGLPRNFQSGTANSQISDIFSAFQSSLQKHRVQYLFTAAEMTAGGLNAGSLIKSITAKVITKNSTKPFNGLTISLANTSRASLNTGFVPEALTQVYSGNYSTVEGDNLFTFTNNFVWNGTSNVAVQICFDNGSAAPDAANDVLEATSVPLGASSYGSTCSNYTSGTTSGCTLSAAYITIPRITLGFTGNTAGRNIETVLNNNRTEYIGGNGLSYFISDAGNNALSSINAATANLGCVTSRITEAGNTWQTFDAGNRSQKVFDITPTTNPGATYTIGLYFTADELAGRTAADLRIAKTTAATLAAADASNTVMSATTVTAFGTGYLFTATFTGFSKFFLVDAAVLLPVQLLTFTGSLNGSGYSNLTWQTASQVNFSHFEVERSYNGTTFTNVGKVTGGSANAGAKQYHFTDAEKAQAENFYRLKMVDVDGRFSYSNVVRITGKAISGFVKLLQNPIADNISLQVNNPEKQTITAALYSATGQVIKRWNPGKVEGNIVLPINTALASGIYNLQVIAGTKTTTLKVSKQ